ncbi:MAG: hypothetical protein QOE06_1125 [Thermoleophilaceae bacterium]|jgi:hypothetical protein|nr:hypothetical protein [Thermoleophilaceae bacterium]
MRRARCVRLRSLAVATATVALVLLAPAMASATVTFKPAAGNATSSPPRAVAAADFNGDGFADAFTALDQDVPPPCACYNADLLPGDGGGALGPFSSHSLGGAIRPRHAASADLNGDNLTDFVVSGDSPFCGCGEPGLVRVLLQQAGGGFSAAASYDVGNLNTGLTIADMNGDTNLDIVASGLAGFSILSGTGSGTFGAAQNFGGLTAPHGVAVADFNGDGLPDLAAADFNDNTAFVILQQAGGGFVDPPTTVDYPVGTLPEAVAAADLNSDGAPDLVTANDGDLSPNGGSVSVLLNKNDGTGDLRAHVDYPAHGAVADVTAADLNGDGHVDLATANQQSGVSVLENQGSGTFGPALNLATASPSTVFNVAVADFNGDGQQDLVAATSDVSEVSVWLNSSQSPRAITGGANGVTATSAGLLGIVDPNGFDTTYSFDYGTSTSYGVTTPGHSAGSTPGGTVGAADVTGLSPNTTYHYRIVATSSFGTSEGDDRTFTTQALSPPSNTEAPEIAGTAQVSQTLTALHGAWTGGPTSYGYQWQSCAAGGACGPAGADWQDVAGATLNHLQLDAPLEGKTIRVRVTATGPGGPSASPSNSGPTAAVAAAPGGGGGSTTGPLAVTGGTTSVTTTGATLLGVAHAHGTATTYHFEYGTVAGTYPNTTTESSASSADNRAASAGISSLTSATTYHYRLVATSTAGTSNGQDESFTTDATPAATPSATTGDPGELTDHTAALNATVNPHGQSTTYRFEFGADATYGHHSADYSAGAGNAGKSVSGDLTGLSPSTPYHYRVVAESAGGTVNGADKTFTTQASPGGGSSAPTAVTGNTTQISDSGATLLGQANPHGSAATYWFEYGTAAPAYGHETTHDGAGPSDGFAAAADVNALSTDTTYHYRLVVDIGGTKSYGADRTFKTTGAVSIVPGQPDPAAEKATVHATITGAGGGDVWYVEWGQSVSYGDQTANAGFPSSDATATLSGLTPGILYHYRYVVRSSTGQLTQGPDETFTTMVTPPIVTLDHHADDVSGSFCATIDGRGSATQGSIYFHEPYFGATHTVRSVALSANDPPQRLCGFWSDPIGAGTVSWTVEVHNSSGLAKSSDTYARPGYAPLAATQAVSIPLTYQGGRVTLCGSVRGGGWHTSYHFVVDGQAGPTHDLSPGPGHYLYEPTPVCEDFTASRVDPSIKFHLVANNNSGQGDGSEQSFAVDSNATVTVGEATDVTATSAKMHATVNPNGKAGDAASFRWGPYPGPSAYSHIESLGATPRSWDDVAYSKPLTGLQPGTTYAYEILVGGQERHTFFTTPAVTSPPTVTGSPGGNTVNTPVACQTAGTCKVTLTLQSGLGGAANRKSSKSVLGSGRASIPGGSSRIVKIRLTKLGKRILRGHGQSVMEEIRTTSGGHTVTETRPVSVIIHGH